MSNSKISTIFYQGNGCSQTQLSMYTGTKGFVATTGEQVVCPKAFEVILNPFVGKEISDVNLKPFSSYLSYINPITLFAVAKSFFINWYVGIKVSPSAVNKNNVDAGSVRYHGIHLEKVSVGQETDINSHREKYLAWQKQKENENDGVIFYGVSRGAGATFTAMAKHKYPNVKMVILEGCFYSVGDVIPKRFPWPLSSLVEYGLTYLAYRYDGPSPGSSVKDFPENIPVIFISSKIDKIVPYEHTKKLAQELADKGKNEVYLLTLNNSSHPLYMFDDKTDRENYECFIHAAYKKYDLPHDEALSSKGSALVEKSLLKPEKIIQSGKNYLPLSEHAKHSAPISPATEVNNKERNIGLTFLNLF